MKFCCLFILLFLMSCSGYVNQIHRQIDHDEKSARGEQSDDADHFAPYRRLKPQNDKRPIRNPVTYSLNESGPSDQIRKPPVKREYRPQRYKADDFIDDDNSGSLWANQGSSSSLFTYQNDKHPGDMVIINVLENLRNQISAELKRVFPDLPKKPTDNSAKSEPKGGAAPGGPTAPAPTTPGVDHEFDMKVYDKISGTVMEEISKDYLLLRGRKQIIFKKEKRSIEVQALVSRKDIMENDYVNSDKLLESRVFILR